MARHGSGSISFDKTRKRWQVAFFDATGKRHYKRFDRDKKELAQQYLTEQLNDINHNTFVSPAKITIGEWTIEWLNTYKKGSVKESTLENYIRISKHFDKLSNICLQDLQPLHVKKLYSDLSANGLSNTTLHAIHSALRSMIKTAYDINFIKKDIMSLVPAPKIEKKEVQIFTKKEIKNILSTAKIYFKKRYPIIFLAVTTGARQGEILGLRWCDIDLNFNTISIRDSLSLTSSGKKLTTPKTKASVRTISIPISVSSIFRELKLKVRNMDILQRTLIFKTDNGTPVDRRNLDQSWVLLLKKANIPYRKFHALRHTHATTLLAEGIPIIEVSRRLGHAKVAHTLDMYGQSIKGYDKKIADKITNIYQL